jgi:hypothetical protein
VRHHEQRDILTQALPRDSIVVIGIFIFQLRIEPRLLDNHDDGAESMRFRVRVMMHLIFEHLLVCFHAFGAQAYAQ